MSIATEMKVETLIKTCESLVQTAKTLHERIALLEGTNQTLLTRVGDLESELEALKDKANGRPQKR